MEAMLRTLSLDASRIPTGTWYIIRSLTPFLARLQCLILGSSFRTMTRLRGADSEIFMTESIFACVDAATALATWT